MTNNVFITGGSRGIGAAAVLAFARAGYNVAFTYNSHPDAADAVRRQAEEINPGGLYLAIRADAGDPAQVRAAVARAEQELGSLQVLVCNAGIAQVKLFTDTTDEDRAALAEETPVERLGEPDEIARTMVFLADEASGYITGQVLGVNGGLVI